MSYNAKVKSFAATSATFETGAANGCYVEAGSAGGPVAVERIQRLPSGAIHDQDGTAAGALTPPKLTQELVFQAANPNAHTQYKNLLKTMNQHGTLTLEVPGASSQASQTVAARLLRVEGTWDAPFRVGAYNTLSIRATWQLKGLLTIS